jgi:hypothetical protein
MTWLMRFAVVCLFLLPPAFADGYVDITGSNIALAGGATLNFSFEFDTTTDKVIGASTFTATGSAAFVAALDLSQLVFEFAVSNAGGVTDLEFACPPSSGASTTLALGANGLSPTIAADLLFPAPGIYGPEIVLLDDGDQGDGPGHVSVTAVSTSNSPTNAATPEPSAALLFLVGAASLLLAKAVPLNRRHWPRPL